MSLLFLNVFGKQALILSERYGIPPPPPEFMGFGREASSPTSQRNATMATGPFSTFKTLFQWTPCTSFSATWAGAEMAWATRWHILLKRLIPKFRNKDACFLP